MKTTDTEFYETALTCFAAAGAASTSLAMIAESTSVPLHEIIARYPSEGDLLEVAFAMTTGRLQADILEQESRDLPPAERFHSMLLRLSTTTDGERSALFVLLREMIDGNSLIEQMFARSLAECYQAFVRVIGEGQLRGSIVPLPPKHLMIVFVSGLIIPQLLGYGLAEGALQGEHAIAADDDDVHGPGSALFSSSLQALLHGALPQPCKPRV